MNRWLHKFMEKPDISDRFELSNKKMENMQGGGPDKTDRFDFHVNMSDLSGRAPGLLGENFSPYDAYDLDERLAIAEYDGEQTALHAHRIAYLDAFISILWNVAEDSPHQDWLAQQIQIALATLERQNFSRLN